jgi:RimJ/RimL family protein N-acetyltransferase
LIWCSAPTSDKLWPGNIEEQEVIDSTNIIQSRRLDLVSLTPAFLQASLARDRATVDRLLGVCVSPEWFDKPALIEMRLAQLRQDPALQPWLLRAMVLRAEQTVVGHIGFHSQPGPAYLADIAPGGVEYGYSVYPAYRRRGYAREACETLMAWATEQHGVTTFVLSIRPDNVPSQQLAGQLGFDRVGSHVDPVDGVEDILLYSR